MNWEEYKKEFIPDGSLRGIYIKDVDLNNWQAFINFLHSTAAVLEFYVKGEISALPSNIIKVVLDNDHSQLLSIRLDGVTINCHFFIPEVIKLDFDPTDIDNEAKAKIVFRFMSTVGRTLNKPVFLTPENREVQPIFIYEPGVGLKYLALDK